MAQVENRVSRTITTPASGTTPATQVNPQGAAIPQGLGSPGTPDIINKFNRITAAHTSVSRSILSRPSGNVAEIVVAGIRGTPNDLVDRVLEHGMDDEPIFLALLDQALA